MHRAACGRASLCGGVRRGCVGEQKCSGGCVAERGRAKVFGGGWVVRSAGNASRSLRACIGAAWGSGSARGGRVAVRGRAKVFGGERVVRTAGNASRSLRACVGAAWGSGSVRKGRVAVRGRAEAFGGEWVVRSAGLTHICRSSTRARVLLYIRPPCPRREVAAMGRKTPPASAHRPRRLSHPPRPRLHFRTRVHTSPASPSAIPAEQSASRSSSYPQWVIHGKVIHIVARRPVQNVLALAPAHAYIYRVRPRAVVAPCPAPPCAGWGRAKAKADAPSPVCRTMSLAYRRMPPVCRTMPLACRAMPLACRPMPLVCRIMSLACRTMPLACRINVACVPSNAACVPNNAACVPNNVACCAEQCRLRAESLCAKSEVHKANPAPARAFSLRQLVYARAPARLWAKRRAQGGGGRRQRRTPPCTATRPCLPTAAPPPSKWEPRLRRREGKRPNGAPPHHNAHTPNAERKRYLHNSRTKTQRRTKRCAQFVFFVFTPCKLLHNFSTVLHRSPRNAPKRAQIAARRPDFPCFTAAFHRFPPESHRAKHPRCAPVLPPKNAPLRAYAKSRPHLRVRGTRQHATTCAFFTFSVRYERITGPLKTNFCPAGGRKRGRLRS